MAFGPTLRKHFWLVPLPLIAISALLHAQAVMQLVGVGMSVDPRDLTTPSPASMRGLGSQAPAARSISAKPILERNPFDHVTGSLIEAPPSDDPAMPGAVDTSDPVNAPTCQGVTVRAIAASGDVDWSFASLVGSDSKPHLVRRGGVFGDKKVYFVGWDRVWLAGEGGLCQTQLFDPKATPAPAPTPAPPPASSAVARGPSRGAPLDPELRKGIQAVSATEFNIDRGVVDRILENQAELMRQARVVPVQENGRVVGVRMNGIRPDSLLGVLGMQNNDRLQTINGFDLASPEKALEAYARLRTADKLTISINRNGKNMNLDYNIR